MAPPRAVPLPLMYLVRAWMTILAPYSIGFKSAGVGTVLSTIKGILAAFATEAIAFRSNTSNFGLPRDSTRIALVFSCIALVKFAVSAASTKVVVMPNLGKVTFNKL